jgi:AraC-like DNA-binding protein
MIQPHARVGRTHLQDTARTQVTRHEIAGLPGVTFVTIACQKPAGGWAVPHYTSEGEFGLTIVRRGGFARRADGVTAYVDPTIAYINLPGTVQQIAHPAHGGDDCTIIALSEDQIVELAGDGVFPSALMQTVPAIDLELRALAIRLRSGADCFEFQERLAYLIGTLVESAWPGRMTTARRPKTTSSHRRIVDYARQAIAADPAGVEISELSNHLGHSKFHVSRIFTRITGTTLTTHRNRVRVAAALDRLSAGEANLAALAADLGFADQSHMVRVLRRSTGAHPSGLRRWFHEPWLPPPRRWPAPS